MAYQYDFEEVKAAVPIREALAMLGIDTPLVKTGKELATACPLDDCSGSKSFKINEAKNVWRCFKCDRGGDVLKLVQLMEDASPFQAAKRLANHAGIPANRPGGNGQVETEGVNNLEWAEGESTDDLIRYLRDAGELDRPWAIVYELVRRRRSRGQSERAT